MILILILYLGKFILQILLSTSSNIFSFLETNSSNDFCPSLKEVNKILQILPL